VRLHRLQAEEEPLCDRAVGQPLGDEAQDLGFARGQRDRAVGVARRRGVRGGEGADRLGEQQAVVMMFGFGFLATANAINTASNVGFAWGMKSFLVYSALVFAGIWTWWALAGRHRAPESLPRPVLPGSGLVDVRLIFQERTDDSETLTVSVAARRTARAEEVISSVLLLQLLPKIPGGERRWRVSIDGELVGIATQTWEHPRWWPQIVWTSDRDASYSGQEVSFSPTRPRDSENAAE
jgi:hypothetical protein